MFSANPYCGYCSASSINIPSRSVLANTDAAAIDEQRRSPLIRVRTGTPQRQRIVQPLDPVVEQARLLPAGQVIVVAVQEHPIGRGRQLRHRALGSQPQRGDDADLVDLGRAGMPDRAVKRPPTDPRNQPLPGLRGKQLRVGDTERSRLGLGLEQDHTDRDRAGQRTPANLIDCREQAGSGSPDLALVTQGRRLVGRCPAADRLAGLPVGRTSRLAGHLARRQRLPDQLDHRDRLPDHVRCLQFGQWPPAVAETDQLLLARYWRPRAPADRSVLEPESSG